jgi:hypothetical protein
MTGSRLRSRKRHRHSGEVLLEATGMEIDFEDPDLYSKVSNLVASAGQQNTSCMT